jgi:hypothetical protein
MPTTRRKSDQPQRSSRKVLRKPHQSAIAPSPITTSDDDRPIWGAAAIGAVIRKSERAAFHLLESGALRGARKVNGQWTARPSVLLRAWESTGEAQGGEAS